MKTQLYCTVLLVLVLAATAAADVYLHIPPGSNNRFDENTRDRRNANRLFDSQNNNRGGYNVQNYFLYEGSELEVRWTNQHACGPNHKTHCNILLQYRCDDPANMRDGAVTATIPETPQGPTDETYSRFGMHEDHDWYQLCKTTERNKGLFTASQQLQGESARFTRQNPGGTRRGLECPEERDYYPYWRPTGWVDIAYLTDEPETLCPLVLAQTENLHPRHYCALNLTNSDRKLIPISPGQCALANGTWTAVPPIAPTQTPECKMAPWTRDNHLGNTLDGEVARYRWKVPTGVYSENCVFRIRYNITTGDYKAWDGADYQQNDRQGEKLGLTEKYGYEAPFTNNPQVDPFGMGFTLQLAINTAQYGRTFQDRSHLFSIRPRPEGVLPTAKIHNLNVEGKRGNIVQVFPGVEYQFAPATLNMKVGDYYHVQWSGSNNNPGNNDGNGQAQTDRSNIAPLLSRTMVYPTSIHNISLAKNAFADLYEPQYRGSIDELNDAGTYFSSGLLQASKSGETHFLCTRNNDFSNRQQKGTIVVEDTQSEADYIGIIVGSIAAAFVVAAIITAGVVYAIRSRSASAAKANAATDNSRGFSKLHDEPSVARATAPAPTSSTVSPVDLSEVGSYTAPAPV